MIHRNVILSKALKNAENQYFKQYNLDSKVLMENAADALLSVIIENVSRDSKICFFCGSGNNGGDGYACAYKILNLGFDVSVIYNSEPTTEDSIFFYNKFLNAGGDIYNFGSTDYSIDHLYDVDVIIDCLYGIGFHGSFNPIDSSIINFINESNSLVISCDLPSGAIADTAEVEKAVCADITVVFSALKAANVSYPAFDYNGKIYLMDIGLPKEILDNISCNDIITLTDETSVKLPKRINNSHKGTYGTTVMYCGSENMIGAAVFSATSALRCGVGMVKICTTRNALNKLQQKLSEPVFSEISGIVENGDSYLVGCGIGKSLDEYLNGLFLNINKPIIIDADGINYISSHIDVLKNMNTSIVLTPHPAEMARLLKTTPSDVNSHRIEYAKRFAKEYSCVVVLKGARTIVASPTQTAINISGSDSLAKAGSGDMLAGIISAYLAMGLSPFDAACSGCFMHGKIGEMSSYHELISEMTEKIDF